AAAGERCSHSGTPGSGTRTVREGTPALRKYFWARMSVATCEKRAGTFTSGASKTTEPSGLTMREARVSKATPAYGSPSAEVKRRGMRMEVSPLRKRDAGTSGRVTSVPQAPDVVGKCSGT